MTRNKSNIIVKDKRVGGKAIGTLPTYKFPNQDEEEYHNSRILLSNIEFEKELLEKDLDVLKSDHKMHVSCNEI